MQVLYKLLRIFEGKKGKPDSAVADAFPMHIMELTRMTKKHQRYAICGVLAMLITLMLMAMSLVCFSQNSAAEKIFSAPYQDIPKEESEEPPVSIFSKTQYPSLSKSSPETPIPKNQSKSRFPNILPKFIIIRDTVFISKTVTIYTLTNSKPGKNRYAIGKWLASTDKYILKCFFMVVGFWIILVLSRMCRYHIKAADFYRSRKNALDLYLAASNKQNKEALAKHFTIRDAVSLTSMAHIDFKIPSQPTDVFLEMIKSSEEKAPTKNCKKQCCCACQ